MFLVGGFLFGLIAGLLTIAMWVGLTFVFGWPPADPVVAKGILITLSCGGVIGASVLWFLLAAGILK